ncbi:hypothetical protein [Sphingobium algorifonticola]|uniref:Uncharacterized protein n=1 Tax=Sphingobium algorifonticola TaxID=2008318 RepID=A0A437JC75_9SPHN|nr:hypothetical protein [Sphingobium algorifonticola]RVT43474.1 hypothetical protein ENE74_02270 [Sphingobium algorifonticola]
METHDLDRFGIRSVEDIALCESSAALETDIRAAPGLSELLQDDSITSHVGHYILNGVIRKLDRPLFLRICDGEIGQMLSNLRGKGEHYMFIPPLQARKIGPEEVTPEAFLKAAGWEVLNDDDHVIFWKAWEKAGSRWV